MSSIKTIIRIITIMTVMMIFLGCRASHEDYGNTIFSTATRILEEKASQYDAIIIIPGSGCTGCISQAELYFSKNKDNERLLFIFTNYYSYKNMSLRLGGSDVLSRNNVYLDADNTFYLHEYPEHIYPYYITIENNTVLSSKPL